MKQLNSTFRRIFKNRLNTSVNFIGLTLSIITFLVIISWVISEESYDDNWSGKDRIYRVALNKKVKGNEVFISAKNFLGAGRVLENEIPEIEAATGLSKDIVTVYTAENSYQNVNMFYADTSLFKVFPRVLQTETDNLFPDIHGVLISRSLAHKLFGNKNPLNRKFKLNEGWEFFVCGVFEDFPLNSHLKMDLLLQWKTLRYYMKYFNNSTSSLEDGDLSAIQDINPYSRNAWSWNGWYTYIKLKEGSSLEDVKAKVPEAIRMAINHFTEDNTEIHFVFQPVNSIHLHSNLEGEMFVNGSSFKVMAFTIIAVLILIVSWFNFINLSSTNLLKRSVDVGVRKALGANRWHIFRDHLSETFVIHFVAGVISLVVVFIVLFNGINLVGFVIPPVEFAPLLFVTLILVLGGSIVSSVFPFLMVIRTDPSFLLKDKFRIGHGGTISRQAVVIFQFGVSIFLIIGTISIFRQIRYMQHQELGLNMEQVMLSFSPMTMNLRPDKRQKMETFREEVKRIPGVIDFTTAASVPGRKLENQIDNVRLPDREKTGDSYWLANVDQNYFDFFSIHMLAGNNFFKESDYDTKDIVINRLASRKLGYTHPENAVNSFVVINEQPYRIVGVVEDHHHHSLREPIRPIVFFKSIKWNYEVGFYCVKVSPQNIRKTIQSVEAVWNRIYPKEHYIFSFMDDEFNAQYEADNRFGSIYMGFSLLTIIIASMGLFALARFSAENRIKEIGVRKVNGAKVSEVLTMLNKDFIKWVAIAFVIATPVAWYAMYKWLENFAYKTTLSWWIFALAGLLALGIALLTVSWQSWKAATRNPVEALRYE